jgi:hypothetical protein
MVLVNIVNIITIQYQFQEWVKEGSTKLHSATNKKAFIRSAKILIPSDWDLPLLINPTSTSQITYEVSFSL